MHFNVAGYGVITPRDEETCIPRPRWTAIDKGRQEVTLEKSDQPEAPEVELGADMAWGDDTIDRYIT